MLTLYCICALVLIPGSKRAKIGNNCPLSSGKKIISHFFCVLEFGNVCDKEVAGLFEILQCKWHIILFSALKFQDFRLIQWFTWGSWSLTLNLIKGRGSHCIKTMESEGKHLPAWLNVHVEGKIFLNNVVMVHSSTKRLSHKIHQSL